MSKVHLFVFVCDSHFEREDVAELRPLGLVEGQNFDWAGAGGADNIFAVYHDARQVDAEHLLVFTGSFHNSVDGAVGYATRVKEANPNAKIYFRSATATTADPIFDGVLRKHDKGRFHGIIREFMEAARQPS